MVLGRQRPEPSLFLVDDFTELKNVHFVLHSGRPRYYENDFFYLVVEI